jgi:hypothetical protein
MPQSALVQTSEINKMSEGKAKSALKVASERLQNMRNRAENAAEKMGTVGVALGTTLTTHVAALTASIAAGYRGAENMDVGGVDVRIIGGLGMSAWGIWDLYRGKATSGAYKLALGNGLTATAISRYGQTIGERMKAASVAKNDKPADTNPNKPADTPPKLEGVEGRFNQIREITRQNMARPENRGAPQRVERREPSHYQRAHPRL